MPMLPPPDHRLAYLLGTPEGFAPRGAAIPYDSLHCEFLAALSSALLADAEARRYADIVSFAYWCRKANIERLRQDFSAPQVRLGLGLTFHITPSNVPVNFAFSFAFSLLAGNANIVRVPSREFAQTALLCRIMQGLFGLEKYRPIADGTVFVRYPQDDAITGAFSALCDARIIWGGDLAINHIRTLPVPERAREIAFADRYSFCVLDAPSIAGASDAEIDRLAKGFFNDTLLMDQDACSSPSLVVWLGGGALLPVVKKRFWDGVHGAIAAKYDLQASHVMEKFMMLCRDHIELDNIAGVDRHENFLYRIELDSLPEQTDSLRGKYGYIYEYHAAYLDDVAPVVNTKYQTLTYFGLDREQLMHFVVGNRLSGIDRVVPVGSALDIDVVWDGYDIVRTLSRIVDFR